MAQLDLYAPNALPSAPKSAVSAGELFKRGQIAQTAEAFEASFLSAMLQPMFAEIGEKTEFGGGPGEQMFKSFMTEAMGKQMARAGGIGLADSVRKEMLKLQGLAEERRQ